MKTQQATSPLWMADARRIAAKFEVKHPHVGGLIRQLGHTPPEYGGLK